MTYAITVKSKGEKRIEKVEGVKELHLNLTLFKAQGWEIAKVKRVK